MSARYSLEKHPKPKGTCPGCGEKKVFRYFQDAEGQRLDEKFGICDRAAKCGHDHRPSGELFERSAPADAVQVETVRPSAEQAERLRQLVHDQTSPFHVWARATGITNEHLERWAVATDRDRTAYLHLDANGQLVNAKWLKYDAEGHRDKLSQPYSFTLDEVEKKTKRFGFCLYGAHLLRPVEEQVPVVVVESEKSAVLASFHYPQFDWVACGAANGITDEKIGDLLGRPIWWLCDADGNAPVVKDGAPVILAGGKAKLTEGGRRNSSLRKLQAYGTAHVVIDLFPDRTDGYDIADALRDGLKPEIVAPAPAEEPAPVARQRKALPADTEEWSARQKDNLYKATRFTDEFVKRDLDLTRNPEDWAAVHAALATLGDHGRALVHRLASPRANYDEAATNVLFDAALDADTEKGVARYTALATHHGINLKDLDAKEDKFADVRSQLPKGVSAEDYFRHGFYEADNAYYSVTKDGPKMVCGFTIKVLYLVKSKSAPKRIVELKNQFGYATVLDLPTEAFVSIGAFKKAVESVGNFVFEGNDIDLTRLKKKLFREEKLTQEINVLGWHPRGQFYAFSNGILNGKWTPTDDYGIVEHDEKNYFLPYMSSINDDFTEFGNERKFVHRPVEGGLDFAQWSDLMQRVYGNNGSLGMCFYIAALFRDYIFEQHNAFPLLYNFGQRESGKSQFVDSFKWLFGRPQDSLSLENPSTVIGMVRTLASFSNSMVYLDEYKNSVDKKTIGLLKGLWDGFGRTTGVKSNDNQTKVTKPLSATIISGQDMPTIDNALFTRVIQLEFLAKGRDYAAYEELKLKEKLGLTSITLDILSHRPAVLELYRPTFDIILRWLKEATKGEDIQDRMLQNMATILAPALLLLDNELLRFPFTKEQLLAIALEVVRRQHLQIAKSTDSSRFWDVFVGMASHKPMPLIVEGVDYRFQGDNLCIRLGNVHPPYLSQHRSQYNVPGLDKTTLDYYLRHDPAFVEQKNIRFVHGKDSETPGAATNPTSAYCFDFPTLKIDLLRQDIGNTERELHKNTETE
jgi:hypothetical protein